MSEVPPIRIGFNGRFLRRTISGVGRYALELLEALSTLKGLEISVLKAPGDQLDARVRSHNIQPLAQNALGWFAWEQLQVPVAAHNTGYDLLHYPATVGNLANHPPTIVTLHDASFIRYPYRYSRPHRLFHRYVLPSILRRSTAVFTTSKFSKEEICSLLGISEERVFVLYNGVNTNRFKEDHSDETRVRKALHLPESFILFVSNQERVKNLGLLIRSFAILSSKLKDVHLVITGEQRSLFASTNYPELVLKLGLAARVHFLGYVNEPSLQELYRAASTFVYPSLYEGFGLPPLEAMASGTPVVASRIPAIIETSGAACLLFDPHDVEDLTEALERSLVDTDLRKNLVAKGTATVKIFTWNKTAEQTLVAYRDILQRII